MTADMRPLPPYRVFAQFFQAAFVDRLLDHAISNRSRFQPSTISNASEFDPSKRISHRLSDLGTLAPEIESRLMSMAPSLMSGLHVTPFEPVRYEIEMVVHGDGAFYTTHVDTDIAPGARTDMHRMVSGVYYFNAEPKRFSGGALRLYSFGQFDSNSRFIEIEPIHNTLVVFPSWVLHEVMPVRCPSRKFLHSRFAINCWLWRQAGSAFPTDSKDDDTKNAPPV
jgi:SM-20-related protein